MTLLSVMSIVLLSALTVQQGNTACPDQNVKKLLEEYRVPAGVSRLIQGKTFVDIWRRKQIADSVDCSVTQFTLDNNKLRVLLRNVKREDGEILHYNELWTEVTGQNEFDVRGEYTEGHGVERYDLHVYVYYVDDYVLGSFTCGTDDDHMRLYLSIVKDKQGDPKAIASLTKAETLMNKLRSLTPEVTVKMVNSQCP